MDDFDKTIPPLRNVADGSMDDLTMPGKRDRKPDGRFAVGDLIMNRYKVLAELGQGGMGVVYKCFDETAGIEIALKALPPELSHNTLEMEDIKDNFQLVHNLHHPNIASSNNLERDNSNGNYYLIMECCEGEDLRRWIKRKRRDGGLTLDDVLPIVKQVADALDYAHEQKIIHRDIKPGNIMIDGAGKIKVLDFGLAAQIHTSMTRVSMAYHGTSGTGPYMAPEQWRGRAQGAAVDQYALAVMTYEMLAGHLPFESTDPAVLQQAVLTQEPEEIIYIPRSTQAAINRGMSKEPAKRFASCLDFVTALSCKENKAAPALFNSEICARIVPIVTGIVIVAVLGFGISLLERRTVISESVRSPIEKNSVISTSAPELPSDRQEDNIQTDTSVEMLDNKNIAGEKSISPGAQVEHNVLSAIKHSEAEAKVYTPEIMTIDCNGVPLEMVRIKAGTFIMGSPEGELGRDNYEKQYQVTLTKDYWLGKFEVTQAQYEAIIGNNPSYYEGGNRPVEQVSWNDAKNFCNKLNGRYAGKLPAGYKFDLPTEAQWEYACRAGTTTALNNGTNLTSKTGKCSNLNKVGWYDENYGSGGHKTVGQKRPNNWGLYDMHGNVWEWCRDWYQSYSGDAIDPVGPSSGSNRVSRGGSWDGNARNCRSARRNSGSPGDRIINLGFRLALVPIEKSEAEEVVSGMPDVIKINCNGVEIEMVKVEPGSFIMSRRDGANEASETAHKKIITKTFYIGKYEVTNEQWGAITGRKRLSNPKYPVLASRMSHIYAMCRKLNEFAPDGWGFTLPTETQWEFAARGGNRSLNYKYSGSNDLDEVGWYRSNSGNKVREVGKKKPNELGLYDMSGNALEWCLDFWTDQSYKSKAEFSRKGLSNAERLNKHLRGVVRGGCFGSEANGCRSGYRAPCLINLGYQPRIGFRLALVQVSTLGNSRKK